MLMDVFNSDIFTAMSMSQGVDKLDYIPEYLSTLPGLFVPDPVRTTMIWIEERHTGAVVLPFSPRGVAPHSTGGDRRIARAFQTLRYGDSSRITSSELLNIRAWNQEMNLKDLQSEVARRQYKIMNNFQLTKEFHKFNCLTMAKVLDADGSLVIDWGVEFNQAIPPEYAFNFIAQIPRAVRQMCTAIRRTMLINLKSVGVPYDIIGLAGNAFWDDLTGSPEVTQTYLNWAAAADLRNNIGSPWQQFRYGDITFVNYRGTDDQTTLGVQTDHCHFFPQGAGIFRWAQSPGERFEHLGQLGQEYYSAMVLDDDRDSWADVEVYSYPLPICTMPSAIAIARRGP
jgi:hypothetical protein